MNPQIVSILTSVGLTASSAVASWAVAKGLVPSTDQSSFANDLLGIIAAVATLGFGWLKTRAVSPTSMIQSINAADNGVKVVSATASAPTVSAPLK
jgi:hypothetical protein